MSEKIPSAMKMIAAFAELVTAASDEDRAVVWRLLKALASTAAAQPTDGISMGDYCIGRIIPPEELDSPGEQS
jgi:hypothetical protein